MCLLEPAINARKWENYMAAVVSEATAVLAATKFKVYCLQYVFLKSCETSNLKVERRYAWNAPLIIGRGSSSMQ